MPTDVLTARAFITSFVLNPPVTTKPTGPDSLVRALRAYRTAVLRALGPRDQAGRLWAEMGEWHSVGRAPRAVRVRPREVALAAARRIQKGVLGAARPYDAEELVSFVWRRGHLQVRVLTLPCHIASRRSARRKRDCVLLSLLLQTSCWADMRLAAQNLARTAIGLVDTSPAASSPTRSTPSPSSPFAVRPCQPDSPVSFPLRVRTPPTLTRFQAELRDYPSRSSYPRARPSRPRTQLSGKRSMGAVTPQVWEYWRGERHGDRTCADVALACLVRAKGALLGVEREASIDRRVQEIVRRCFLSSTTVPCSSGLHR